MTRGRAGLLGCALAAFVLTGAPAVWPQDFPSHAIKIIVPNPPGGTGDIAARLVGKYLSENLHQPVVVENQAGASGSIGMTMLKRAAPDGHTFGVVISLAQIVDRIQNKTSSFDLVTDFTPITTIANNPVVLVANSRIAATSMKGFIDYARMHPGEVTFSSPGIGTAHHLYGEMLNKVAGLRLVNVPYKGVVPALNDLLGGHVQTGIISLAPTLQHIESGKIHPLVLFDAKRHPRLPDVPIITEVLPHFELARSWVGFMAPPEMPAAVTDRLHAEIVRVLRSPDVQKTLGENGLEVVANSAAEFAEIVRRDTAVWTEAATAAGLISQ